MKLGERIRELRNQRGISQRALGKSLGVWQTTIAMIENSESLPSMTLLRDLAKYFDMEASELIDKVEIARKEPA